MTIDFDTQILVRAARVQMRLGDFFDARPTMRPRMVMGIVLALQDNGEATTGDGWIEVVKDDEEEG